MHSQRKSSYYRYQEKIPFHPIHSLIFKSMSLKHTSMTYSAYYWMRGWCFSRKTSHNWDLLLLIIFFKYMLK